MRANIHYLFYISFKFQVPVSDDGDSPGIVGLPASAQYAQVIRNRPHTSPTHDVVRLHPLIASQMHPKQVCVTGASCPPEIYHLQFI